MGGKFHQKNDETGDQRDQVNVEDALKVIEVKLD